MQKFPFHCAQKTGDVHISYRFFYLHFMLANKMATAAQFVKENEGDECTVHPGCKFVMICLQCNNEFVCTKCVAGPHLGHKMGEMENYLFTFSNNIKKHLDTIEKEIKIKKLNNKYNRKNMLFENHYLVEEVQSHFGTYLKDLQDYKEDLLITALQHFENNAHEINDVESQLELANTTYFQLKKEIDQIIASGKLCKLRLIQETLESLAPMLEVQGESVMFQKLNFYETKFTTSHFGLLQPLQIEHKMQPKVEVKERATSLYIINADRAWKCIGRGQLHLVDRLVAFEKMKNEKFTNQICPAHGKSLQTRTGSKLYCVSLEPFYAVHICQSSSNKGKLLVTRSDSSIMDFSDFENPSVLHKFDEKDGRVDSLSTGLTKGMWFAFLHKMKSENYIVHFKDKTLLKKQEIPSTYFITSSPAVCFNDDLVLIDRNKDLFFFDKNLKTKSKVEVSPVTNNRMIPLAICCNGLSEVYVLELTSKSVIKFANDGTFLGMIYQCDQTPDTMAMYLIKELWISNENGSISIVTLPPPLQPKKH